VVIRGCLVHSYVSRVARVVRGEVMQLLVRGMRVHNRTLLNLGILGLRGVTGSAIVM
jgi:hypothetical protein